MIHLWALNLSFLAVRSAFNWFYGLSVTADPDLNQDLAPLRYCLSKWSLHY